MSPPPAGARIPIIRLDLPPPPWIVGHRGAAGVASENTLESLRAGASEGADLVEIDLQLTADQELVAYHDWDLRRLHGDPGEVEALELDELRTRTRGVVPTLAEALAALPPSMPVNLELKRRRAGNEELLRALAAVLGTRPQILLSSFDWRLLALCRRRLPGRPLAPLAAQEDVDLAAAGRELAAFSVHCHLSLASHELVRAAGRPLLVYTVDRAGLARELLAMGAAGLFSDYPGRLRRQLEREDG